jgi:ribosomal protein L11
MSYQGNNPEGYPDPTANQAVGIVSREEKEAAKAKKRATREYDIRAAMKAIAGAYGLTIENRIIFKDKETEETYR